MTSRRGYPGQKMTQCTTGSFHKFGAMNRLVGDCQLNHRKPASRAHVLPSGQGDIALLFSGHFRSCRLTPCADGTDRRDLFPDGAGVRKIIAIYVDELPRFFGNILLEKNRLYGAHGNTRAAVNTQTGINEQHCVFVGANNAIHRTGLHT